MNVEQNYTIDKSQYHQQHTECSSSNVELDNDEESFIWLVVEDDGDDAPAVEQQDKKTALVSTGTSSTTDTCTIITSNGCWPRQNDWIILVFGQGIALSLACCSISSAQLQNMSGIAHVPLFQVSFGYFALQMHFYFLKKQSDDDDDDDEVKYVQNSAGKQVRLDSMQEQQLLLQHDSKECCHNESSSLLFRRTLPQDSENKNITTSTSFWNVKLQSSWYYYALVAFLDVQANYFVVLSFRYTAVVHSTILTSISVISVMASSRLILGKRFQTRHFMGAILCVIGASCVISLDVTLPHSSSGSTSASNSVHGSVAESGTYTYLGDSFAVIAALMFGLNDSLAEYTIQNSTPDEYLAMMGMFGFLFSFCESLIFENAELRQFFRMIWNYNHDNNDGNDDDDDDDKKDDIHLLAILILWVWYIATFYTFYACASQFLRIADATLLSLSLQTSNLWTMIFSVFVQDFSLSPLFLCSVAMILFGVWLYERG